MSASPFTETDKAAHSTEAVDFNSNDKVKKTTLKTLHCDICKISASSFKNLEDHKKGRKHLNKTAKLNKRDKLSNINELEGRNKMSVDSSDNNRNYSLQDNRTLNVAHGIEKYSRHNSRHRDNHSKTYRSHRNHSYDYNTHDHYNQFLPPPHPNNRNYLNVNHGYPWQQNSMFCNKSRNGIYPTHQGNNSPYNPVYCDQNVYPLNNRPGYEEWCQNSENYNDMHYSENNVAVLENCKNSYERSVSVGVYEKPGQQYDAENQQVRENLSGACFDDSADACEKSSTKHLKENSVSESLSNPAGIAENATSTIGTSSDADLQLEKRGGLSENMTGKRIAHWIKPSNMKDKAEVMKLVNEFSKSKKKENLLRLKLQADSVSNENSYGEKEASSNEPFIFPSSNSIEENNCTVQSPSSSDRIAHEPSENSSKSPSTPRKRKCSKANTDVSITSPIPVHRSLSVSDMVSTASKSSKKSLSESTDRPAKKVRRKSSNSSQGSSRGGNAICEVSAQRKRKDSLQGNSSTKQHKCSSAECLEACINEVVTGGESWSDPRGANGGGNRSDPRGSTESSANLTNPRESSVNSSVTSALVENVLEVPVKQEIFEFQGDASQLHPSILEAVNMTEMAKKQFIEDVYSVNGPTLSPVESLINLFASGSVRVKKEFDDPAIDILRTVDPAVLERVCGKQTSKTTQNAAPENFLVQNASVSHNNADLRKEVHSSTNSFSLSNANSASSLELLKNSLSDVLNEIQTVSSLEEKVKKNIEKSDYKIQEYQGLLDEWKIKKLKYISDEEVLRKTRNDLLKTMTDLVTQHNAGQSSVNTDLVNGVSLNRTSVPPINTNPTSKCNEIDALQPEVQTTCDNTLVSEDASVEILPTKNPRDDVEEISIVSVPEKNSSDIPLIVLDDMDSHKEDQNSTSLQTKAILENFSRQKDISAHTVSINSIQVHEDFLYTCSNDNTAKRFDLKDYTKIVTYLHQKKNVTQLCVQKIRDTNLVFTTTSSSKQISSFKAEDGTLLKTFSFTSSIASICKGKGLIYAGLRSGSIVSCNWKDYVEVVNIAEPIRSIDTTYQGGLNVLVTLSVNGNVSIRDADRNGLLIRYVKARSYVPLFMTVCSDSIYLSSAGVLTVLDIATGRFVTKYSFAAAYTSLAVYRDTIFTASFSGLVRCYSKDEEKEVKMYYGAGSNAITCINVYHGWVFTGNRAGEVSAFKYDPINAHPCKIGNCDFLFPRLEDLEFHVLFEKDHDLPAAGSMCSWGKCSMPLPKNCSKEAIKAHMRTHFTL